VTEPIEDGFDLDAAWAEERRDPFRFRWAGVWWTVPHLSEIVDWRQIADADSMDLPAIQKLLRTGMGERAEEWERVTQPVPAMFKLYDQWLAHSGMTPGEALGSDDSSVSTEEPSPPTSTDTTGSPSGKPSSAPRKRASRSRS
jgi:hypothetical protein